VSCRDRGVEVVVEIADDEYFVLGDNRGFSLDSRTFGPLREEYIIGRTWIRGWPFNKIMVFDSLDYNISIEQDQ